MRENPAANLALSAAARRGVGSPFRNLFENKMLWNADSFLIRHCLCAVEMP